MQASRANSTGLKRVPAMAALAGPHGVRRRHPTAQRAANARSLRASSLFVASLGDDCWFVHVAHPRLNVANRANRTQTARSTALPCLPVRKAMNRRPAQDSCSPSPPRRTANSRMPGRRQQNPTFIEYQRPAHNRRIRIPTLGVLERLLDVFPINDLRLQLVPIALAFQRRLGRRSVRRMHRIGNRQMPHRGRRQICQSRESCHFSTIARACRSHRPARCLSAGWPESDSCVDKRIVCREIDIVGSPVSNLLRQAAAGAEGKGRLRAREPGKGCLQLILKGLLGRLRQPLGYPA